MKLSPGLHVSSSSSRHSEDRGLHQRLPTSDALLARPKMVHGGPGSPGHGCSLPSGHAGSDRPHVGPSSSPASSSTRLEDFRRLRGLCIGRLLPPHPAVGVPLQQLATTLSGACSRTFAVPAEFSSFPLIRSRLSYVPCRSRLGVQND